MAIAAVHVAAWRSTYAGILPADYLARMSGPRQAAHYLAAIRGGVGVFVATHGDDGHVIGFATATHARRTGLAEGEIETLYVLDDFRDQGAGRLLLSAAAAYLALLGCRSTFVWVLRDNPSRWFYARLGGRPKAEETIHMAGQALVQTAYIWADTATLVVAQN